MFESDILEGAADWVGASLGKKENYDTILNYVEKYINLILLYLVKVWHVHLDTRHLLFFINEIMNINQSRQMLKILNKLLYILILCNTWSYAQDITLYQFGGTGSGDLSYKDSLINNSVFSPDLLLANNQQDLW